MKPRILGAPGLDNQAVTNALVSIGQQVRGFVYASCWNCESKEDAVAYRDEFGQRELMLIWPDFQNWDLVANKTADMFGHGPMPLVCVPKLTNRPAGKKRFPISW